MHRCTTHALYRSKLWQQDHCQHPQNANPDGSTCPGWGKQSFRLGLWSLVRFQVRATSCHLTSFKPAWKSTSKCTWCAEECGDPLSSIWPLERTLSGTTTPGQSGPENDLNEGLLHISQSSSITGTSPLIVSCYIQNTHCREAVGVFYSPSQLGNPQTGNLQSRQISKSMSTDFFLIYFWNKLWNQIKNNNSVKNCEIKSKTTIV